MINWPVKIWVWKTKMGHETSETEWNENKVSYCLEVVGLKTNCSSILERQLSAETWAGRSVARCLRHSTRTWALITLFKPSLTAFPATGGNVYFNFHKCVSNLCGYVFCLIWKHCYCYHKSAQVTWTCLIFVSVIKNSLI